MKKADVMNRIGTDVVLSEVAKYEQVALETIVDQALAYPAGVNRWRAYERLKSEASEMVGWYATHSELTTNRHYEAVIGLIDELLPLSSEEDIDDTDELMLRRKRGSGLQKLDFDGFLRDLEQRREKWLEGQMGS